MMPTNLFQHSSKGSYKTLRLLKQPGRVDSPMASDGREMRVVAFGANYLFF